MPLTFKPPVCGLAGAVYAVWRGVQVVGFIVRVPGGYGFTDCTAYETADVRPYADASNLMDRLEEELG
jgi:hypothetical protein